MAELVEEQTELKIIVVGDQGVGKSCLITRFIEDTFTISQAPTVGAAFLSKEITFQGKKITLNIWDTAGQENYRYLVPMYYRNADIAILSFDLTRSETLKNVYFWKDDIFKNLGDDVTMVLCANKQDMESCRQVTEDDIQEITQQLDLTCVETSAFSGTGVSKLFEVALNLYSSAHPELLGKASKDNQPSDSAIAEAKRESKCC